MPRSVVVSRFACARETTDTAPTECREQLNRAFAVDVTRCGEPETRADLRGTGQSDRQQARLVLGGAGVFRNRHGDGVGTLTQCAFDPVTHRGLVAQVGLEDEPKRLAVAGDKTEVRR